MTSNPVNTKRMYWGLFGVSLLVLSSLLILKYQPWATYSNPSQVSAPPEAAPSAPKVSYRTIKLEHSLVHVVNIPATTSWQLTPIIASEGLNKVEALIQTKGKDIDETPKVIAAINGGFFDPNNQQTTSYIIQEGQVSLDPSQNSRLVDNPDLSQYMERILNRSEFRRYQCQGDQQETIRYAIAPRNESPPDSCTLIEALGAGPALLPLDRGEEEAFIDTSVGRDALGSQYPNARSAVGITAEGEILLVMAAQISEIDGPSGLTLPELADVMQSLQVQQGLNLDGGSSSSLYYQGTIYYGRLDAKQSRIERPVKSILAVQSR